MKEVKILEGQTFIDIAVQELGDATRGFELALLNGKAITDDLTPGDYIQVPAADITKKNIIKVFTDPANLPASAVIGEEITVNQKGIGVWVLGVNFMVS